MLKQYAVYLVIRFWKMLEKR